MEATEPRTVTARKRHRCYWCGEWIEPGDKYVTWTCFDDGPSVCKVHPECKAAWDRGMDESPQYYGEESHEAEHCRGCLCGSNRCDCKESRDGE